MWFWQCQTIKSQWTKYRIHLFSMLSCTRIIVWGHRIYFLNRCLVCRMYFGWNVEWSTFIFRSNSCRLISWNNKNTRISFKRGSLLNEWRLWYENVQNCADKKKRLEQSIHLYIVYSRYFPHKQILWQSI